MTPQHHNQQKDPIKRRSTGMGAAANSSPPRIAKGTAPNANQAITPKCSSLRLNHTRLPLPINWATVRMGIASRTPKNATRTGSSTAAPPNPEMAARVAAANATAAEMIQCSNVSIGGLQWMKRCPRILSSGRHSAPAACSQAPNAAASCCIPTANRTNPALLELSGNAVL
jgi:hypothetical protein